MVTLISTTVIPALPEWYVAEFIPDKTTDASDACLPRFVFTCIVAWEVQIVGRDQASKAWEDRSTFTWVTPIMGNNCDLPDTAWCLARPDGAFETMDGDVFISAGEALENFQKDFEDHGE